ncbi:MAG: hypothetical protein IJH43_02630 [Mogibacterium sp.]|nr:hypothetical protein [Mogibacterium sp.]
MSDNLVYEKKILIRSEQVDMSRRLRISELFRIMEEASIAHTEELGCTRHKTLDRGLLWVIARQSAEISELPYYDDEIVIRSWQGNMLQMFFPRIYEIYKEGRCIIRGYAFWTLIDEESRDLVMPEDYDISIPSRPDSEEFYLQAVVIPKGAEPVMSRDLRVRFSQVDINGHMNNTRYFDIIDDVTKEDPAKAAQETVPKSILANYVSELTLGENFTLNEYSSGNDRIFEGTDSKNKFRIKFSY